MQALRAYWQQAGAAELTAALQSGRCAAVQLQGYPPDLDLPALLRRDVLAMAVCRLAILQEGEVYGGFVRDMLSGLHWQDVDLCFLHRHSITRFKQTLSLFLELLLGIPAYSAQLLLCSVSGSHGSHRYELRWRDVVVPVDITCRSTRPGTLPATLGSSLVWTHAGLEWRPLDCDPSTTLMSVPAMVALLQQGQDIVRCPTHGEWARMPVIDHPAAEAYRTAKTKELEKRGYTFVASHGLALASYLATRRE